jgi:hypothetical protein
MPRFPRPRRRGSGSKPVDRAIGIVLGLLLGLAIVIGFVFFGSREAIDAPSLSGDDQQPPAATQPAEPPATQPQQTEPGQP